MWSSSLSAYVQGGTEIPEAPEPPEWMQEDQAALEAAEEAKALAQKLIQTLTR